MGLSGPKKNANRCACWHYKPEPTASEGAWPPAGSLGKKEHRGRHSSTRDKWLRSHRYIVLVQNQRPRLGPKETRVYVASVALYITDPSGKYLPGELSGNRPTPRTAGRCKAGPHRSLWLLINYQSWAPPPMGGEGKPVAAHCTPEQKQIAACQKLRATIELLGMQARSFGWALRAGKSALQHGRRPHNNR